MWDANLFFMGFLMEDLMHGCFGMSLSTASPTEGPQLTRVTEGLEVVFLFRQLIHPETVSVL